MALHKVPVARSRRHFMRAAGPQLRRVPLQARGSPLPRLTSHDLPVLVKGGCDAWPARRWSIESLKQLKKAERTPALIQRGVVEQGYTRPYETQPFASYMAWLSEQTLEDPEGLLRTPTTEKTSLADHRLEAVVRLAAEQSYLPQFELTRAFPHLRKDLHSRDFWPFPALLFPYAWIGPAGTITGLHTDSSSNCFAQLLGSKWFFLFAPDQRDFLHPSPKYDWGSELSLVDIARWCASEEQQRAYPRFAQASGHFAHVEAGDVLFVPRGWWHAVVSLERSVSVSIFGLTPWQILTEGVPITVKHWLHDLGFYRSHGCTCHPAVADKRHLPQ